MVAVSPNVNLSAHPAAKSDRSLKKSPLNSGLGGGVGANSGGTRLVSTANRAANVSRALASPNAAFRRAVARSKSACRRGPPGPTMPLPGAPYAWGADPPPPSPICARISLFYAPSDFGSPIARSIAVCAINSRNCAAG